MAAPDINVRSVRTTLPGPPIDNATLARRFGMGEAWQSWVDTFVGTAYRHYAVDLETGETMFTLADLGAMVGAEALSAAGVEPGEVDLIVLGTASPDELMPATVNVIADRLGVNGVPELPAPVRLHRRRAGDHGGAAGAACRDGANRAGARR